MYCNIALQHCIHSVEITLKSMISVYCIIASQHCIHNVEITLKYVTDIYVEHITGKQMYQKTVVASNRVAATAMIQETSGEQLPTEENGDNIEGYAPEEFAPMPNTAAPLREYIDNINNTLANPIIISLDNQTTEEEGRTIEGDALTYPE